MTIFRFQVKSHHQSLQLFPAGRSQSEKEVSTLTIEEDLHVNMIDTMENMSSNITKWGKLLPGAKPG